MLALDCRHPFTRGVKMNICEMGQCSNPVMARSLCQKHYARLLRHGSATGGGTDRRARQAVPCSVDGCELPQRARGVCYKHYKQWEYHGFSVEKRPHMKAARRYLDGNGYVCFSDRSHHCSDKNGRVLEHRAVMSEKLGRPLLPGENVHHINGNRADNDPDNLELWVTLQPSGQRPEDLLAYAREIIARYG